MPRLRNRHLFLLDLVLLPAAAVLAFVLRLDAQGLLQHSWAILLFIALSLPIKLVVFHFFGLYSRYWRYASADELVSVTAATILSLVISGVLLFAVALPLSGIRIFPRSIPFIDALLTVLVVGGPRFAVRLIEHRRMCRRRSGRQGPQKRVLIMGAGSGGAMIAREMQDNPQVGLLPVGFVDDDGAKHGTRIHSVPVLGDRSMIPHLVNEYRIGEVIIAMPTVPGIVIREVFTICQQAGVAARTMPGLYEVLSGDVSVNLIRDVDIVDLLRREPVQTDVTAVESMLSSARVLVTGAGGSIGSELCRQIARCEPAALTLVGHGENSIFAIANEVRRLWPALALDTVIADVRDLDRLDRIFERCQPQVVFHAAAHKHVPLMEANPCEAVTNNVLGTSNLLQLAERYSVGHFVLISTDKAVNPTSVMGTTKRVAELLVQEAARRTDQPYVAVRFGNVLGSRGSVVPTFRDQIARGGPVTVTHPDVRRYFMTIPEAVQLVLQAATLGNHGGEVFLLDMGDLIRVSDLARDLIQLSGLEVGRDIDIVYTGLRPGEKLYEELFVKGEQYGPTRHEKVFISHNGAKAVHHPADLDQAVRQLVDLAQRGKAEQIRTKLQEIVPEYTPGSVGQVDVGEGKVEIGRPGEGESGQRGG